MMSEQLTSMKQQLDETRETIQTSERSKRDMQRDYEQ